MSKLTRRTFMAAGGTALVLPALRSPAAAQGAWPNKPIRIVVPYPAGGQTDGIGRVFGDFLTRQLGQPAVVENKAGGGGVIGVTEVKRAAPDGYTILCTISSSLIQNRLTVKDLPYDPEKDFIYLSRVAGAGGPVVAAEKTGASNLKEFIAYAKKVDKLNWGSYGVGSTPHVLIETMAKQYGLKVEVIQYRGEAPMWADVAAQTLDGASGSYAAASPVIQSGRGKLIAVTGDRLKPHPDTPTMMEQGAVGGFYESRAFTTFAVPAGTPQDIVKRLADLLLQAGSDAKVKTLLDNYLLNPPEGFEATNKGFKRDTEIMLGLLSGLGIKPE
jgi:tripartite-type tricarboxylate transporter receptor subunit TctC